MWLGRLATREGTISTSCQLPFASRLIIFWTPLLSPELVDARARAGLDRVEMRIARYDVVGNKVTGLSQVLRTLSMWDLHSM